MRCTLDDAVTDWVIDHPESEAVFQELGIPSHCGGKSLEFVCQEQGLDVQQVLAILHEAIGSTGGDNAEP